MRLSAIPPIRQLSRFYSAILSIDGSLQEIRKEIDRQGAALPSEIKRIGDSLNDLSRIVERAIPDKHQIDIHVINGYRLLLDRASLVDRLVIEQGEWEGPQVRQLISLAERFRGKGDAIFLDVGSFWGYYTFMLHKTGLFSQIHAFDADKSNFSQLQSNVLLNGLSEVVKTHNFAVSDRAGLLTVRSSSAAPDGNRGAARVLEPHEIAGEASETSIQCDAIDNVIKVSNANIVVKMDVEAHEDRALKGMRELFSKNNVIAQIEIYDEQEVRVLPVIEELGLRPVGKIYPDHFFTNLPPDAIAG